MLPEATRERVTRMLAEHGVVVAYHLTTLPRGVMSAARGGLALLFPATTAPGERYERCQQLRFSTMGLLPTGHSEMIALNDARLPIAAAVVTDGAVILERAPAARQRFEITVACQALELAEMLDRWLGS